MKYKEQEVSIYDENLMSALKSEIKHNIITETEQIRRDYTLIDINNENEVLITNLNNNNKVFFYFSNIHCNTCIDRELQFIKKYYAPSQVVIIVNGKNLRELLVYRKNQGLADYNFYMVKNREDIGLSSENTGTPIFFRIRNDNKIYNIYNPKFSYPTLSEEYHKTLSSLLKL